MPARGQGVSPSISWVVGALTAAWGFLLGARTLYDNSFFTHLATGRLILEQGAVPAADPYSYSAPGVSWVVQSWFASVSYAVAERAGGGAGVRMLNGVLTALLLLALWRLSRPASALVGRVVIVALAGLVGGTMWTSRPFMFGFLALAIVLLVVEEPAWPVWVAAPVCWVWANTHGSFPLGLVALAALALGRRFDGERPTRELRVAAWAAGGMVAGVVGPLGLHALTFPVALLGKSEVLQRVIEWQSPSFYQTYARLFLVMVCVAIALIVRSPSWRRTVPFMVFTAISLLAVRNIGIAIVVFVPVMASAWRNLGSLRGAERGPAVTLLAALVTVGGLVGAGVAVAGPAYDLSSYPVDGLRYVLDTVAPDRDGCRLLVDDTNGNLIELLEGTGGPGVLLDDRYDMYPNDVINDYLRLHSADPGWYEAMERWKVSVVLWNRRQPLASLLLEDERWRVSYSDETWVVFVRRASETSCRR